MIDHRFGVVENVGIAERNSPQENTGIQMLIEEMDTKANR